MVDGWGRAFLEKIAGCWLLVCQCLAKLTIKRAKFGNKFVKSRSNVENHVFQNCPSLTDVAQSTVEQIVNVCDMFDFGAVQNLVIIVDPENIAN